MRTNGLLKWLMVPMAVLLVFVGIRLFSGGTTPPPDSRMAGSQLTPAEREALGIEGDTPADTVATLVAQVRQLRDELKNTLSDNRDQRAENARLRQRERSIDQRIGNALDTERAQLRQDRERIESERLRAQSLLQDLQRHLQRQPGAPGGRDGHADLPIGLGLEAGDGQGVGQSVGQSVGQGFGQDSVRWIEPDDVLSSDTKTIDTRAGNKGHDRRGRFSFPGDDGQARNAFDTRAPTPGSTTQSTAGPAPLTAVYTVPENATLMGSVAMTALIGRVPIDGTVNDPYPFKVVIGADNLTANGIELPDVAGAVVSGTASGDWTLACVRGQIRSITFVFQDGTIRTVPEASGRGSGANGSRSSSNNSGNRGGLGWISDLHGVPCVAGERRSNARQYLGTQALITAAGAGAASLIDADSGQVSYISSDGSIGTVGIGADEAMGRVLAGGVQEMAQWVNKLYGQAFAAVYVAPGAPVAVHIEQSLTLDYDGQGRRVDHRLGGKHVSTLD